MNSGSLCASHTQISLPWNDWEMHMKWIWHHNHSQGSWYSMLSLPDYVPIQRTFKPRTFTSITNHSSAAKPRGRHVNVLGIRWIVETSRLRAPRRPIDVSSFMNASACPGLNLNMFHSDGKHTKHQVHLSFPSWLFQRMPFDMRRKTCQALANSHR